MKVIYIDIDSLRPDHMGCYGYERPTTPNLDELAAKGVCFDRCFTTDSPCMPSRSATMSGTFGIKNGIVTHGDQALVQRTLDTNLPQTLRAENIRSAAISSFGRHPSPWFYVGWGDYIDDPACSSDHFQHVSGELVTNYALDWLKTANHEEDFFLYVQYWDPHTKYGAPEHMKQESSKGLYPPFPTKSEVEQHQSMDSWRSAPMSGIHSYEDWKDIIDEYDAEIMYADQQVGRLLQGLKSMGLEEEALIMISADHGEEFGEHGVYCEHWSTYNGTARVPLIVKPPASWNVSPLHHQGLVYQVDIADTVLDAFGLKKPDIWDSESLLPKVKGQTGRDYLVVGHGLYTAQRAVITNEWKMIRTYHPGHWELPDYQLFSTEDVWERNDVSVQYPEIVSSLADKLKEWETAHNVTGHDPMMMNAEEGPFGLTYADQARERFRMSGAEIENRLNERKS